MESPATAAFSNVMRRLGSWVALGSLALASAILSMTSVGAPGHFLGQVFIGAMFGVAFCTYFVLCKGLRSGFGIVILIAGSILAHFAAGWASFPLGFLVVSPFLVVVGGFIGGLILTTVTVVVLSFPGPFSPRPPEHSLVVKIAIGSIVSAVVGIVAWSQGPSWGKALWTFLPTTEYGDDQTFGFYSLYFVWQPVMALLIGALVDWGRQSPIIGPRDEQMNPGSGLTSKKESMLDWKVLLLLLLVLTSVVLFRTNPLRATAITRDNEQKRRESDTPSVKNLPPIEPMSSAQTFLTSDIEGFHMRRPTGQQEPGDPRSFYHELSYSGDDGEVTVEIWEYPNSQWARYQARYYGVGFGNPKHHAVVTKFQSKVRTNLLERSPLPGSGNRLGEGTWPPYFMWSSGNCVVSVTFHTGLEHDEFLRPYLQKYPSSVE